MAKQKVAILTSGERVHILREEGKWLIADGRRFRKLSQMVASVVEEDADSNNEPMEKAPAKRKKKTRNTEDG